jgi:hypothetical protein
MRIWLGVMRLQADVVKLRSAENRAFLHNNGAGVAEFVSHGVVTYSWWEVFSIVSSSRADWIGIQIPVTEFSVGACLTLDFLTPLVVLERLFLLFIYVMSETSSVCSTRCSPLSSSPCRGRRDELASTDFSTVSINVNTRALASMS